MSGLDAVNPLVTVTRDSRRCARRPATVPQIGPLQGPDRGLCCRSLAEGTGRVFLGGVTRCPSPKWATWRSLIHDEGSNITVTMRGLIEERILTGDGVGVQPDRRP